MKKIYSKVILLVLISFLILFLVLKDNYYEIIEILKESNIKYIIIGFVVVLIGDLFKSLSITNIIKKEKDYKLKNGFMLVLQTNFFNGITPFCLGGQPYQIYSLKKNEKINYEDGIKIVFKDFYAYQMSLVIISSICLLINRLLNIIEFNNVIKTLIFFGYLLNLIIALFLMYLPFSKDNGKKIIKLIVKILYKFKLIKDKDITTTKFNKSIIDFKENIKNTLKNKVLIIKCIVFNLIKILSVGITTYFCFKGVGVNIPILESIIFTIITMTMASFIPIPGSSGGMEYGFITLFSAFAVSAELNASLLIWRTLTYYVLVIIGGFLFAVKNRE